MPAVLNRKVLVLNLNYEPIGVCNVKRAVILLFLGKGEVIEHYQNSYIRSTSSMYPAPSIIRLYLYIYVPQKKLILTRRNVLKRDNYQCQYCGTRNLPMTVDHIIPKDQGGSYTWENLVCACTRCNTKKGNRTPEEARFTLRTKPKRPNNIIFIQNVIGIADERWKPYLFLN
jgi:5-methylcytosine-specific restriction endonuclease McrA